MISTKRVAVKCLVKRPKEVWSLEDAQGDAWKGEKQGFAAKVSVCLETEFGFETELTSTCMSKILS